jgi:hypothetical protein
MDSESTHSSSSFSNLSSATSLCIASPSLPHHLSLNARKESLVCFSLAVDKATSTAPEDLPHFLLSIKALDSWFLPEKCHLMAHSYFIEGHDQL